MLNRVPVEAPVIESVTPTIDDVFPVSLDAPAACPRYLCRVVRGIDNAAKTPEWMVEKLRRSGIRAIAPVVDITNFVLMETGQPLHAYDTAAIKGGKVVVRKARRGGYDAADV